MELTEVQQKILENNGKSGLGIYNKGVSFGKTLGQKVKQDAISKEVATIVSQAVTAKSKDGFNAPDKTGILGSISRKIPLDKEVTRGNVKTVIKDLILFMDSLPKPEPKKSSEPNPSSD